MNLIKYGVPEELSQFVIDYIEEVKELISSDLWENVFLNCSKNEVLVGYRNYQPDGEERSGDSYTFRGRQESGADFLQ